MQSKITKYTSQHCHDHYIIIAHFDDGRKLPVGKGGVNQYTTKYAAVRRVKELNARLKPVVLMEGRDIKKWMG